MSDRAGRVFSRGLLRCRLALPALFTIALGASSGCSGNGNAGLSVIHGCASNADCGASQECSGNLCVNFLRCDSAATCPLGQNCVAQVCRETCASEVQCAPLKLSCDSTAGVCLPTPSASATAGSAGASPSGGEAGAGGGSAGTSALGGATAAGGSLVASASADGGGSAGSGGSAGTNSVGAPPLDVTDLIDDLEDGDTSILTTNGRMGQWYFYNPSGTNVTGDIAQTIDSKFAGANGSKFSIETKGGPLSGDSARAYAGLAFDFDNAGNTPTNPARKPYDLSAWNGISFWAKGNLPGQSVRVELATLEVVAPAQGGTCMDGGNCYDTYGKSIALTGEWSQYELPFDAFTQESWGTQTALDLTAALGIDFEYDTPSGSFDFAIDDVALYRTGSSSATDGSGGTCPAPDARCQ